MIRMRFKLTKIRNGHDDIRVLRFSPIEDKEIPLEERATVGKPTQDLDITIDNPEVAQGLKLESEYFLSIEEAPAAQKA